MSNLSKSIARRIAHQAPGELADRINDLRSQLAKAKWNERRLGNALIYYADPDTYFAIGIFPDHPCGDFINDFETDESIPQYPDGPRGKPGAKARAALIKCYEPKEET